MRASRVKDEIIRVSEKERSLTRETDNPQRTAFVKSYGCLNPRNKSAKFRFAEWISEKFKIRR